VGSRISSKRGKKGVNNEVVDATAANPLHGNSDDHGEPNTNPISGGGGGGGEGLEEEEAKSGKEGRRLGQKKKKKKKYFAVGSAPSAAYEGSDEDGSQEDAENGGSEDEGDEEDVPLALPSSSTRQPHQSELSHTL
jgi:hypothetical protein